MCVYNKKNMCIYVCVWGCLDKYISVATWPPQTKIPGSAPASGDVSEAVMLILQIFFFEQIILQIDVSLITKGRKILKALQVLLYIVTNWCVIECDWCKLIKIINECLNYFL